MVDATMDQARRIGAPRAIALCHIFYGALAFQFGNWDEAETELRAAIDLSRQLGTAAGEVVAGLRLGELQTARGQVAEGLATFEESLVAARHALLRSHLYGRLHGAIAYNRLVAGDAAAADQALAQGLATAADHGHCVMCESLALPVGVSVRLAQGDLAGAQAYYRDLEAAAARYDNRAWQAMTHKARGELAEAEGDLEQARVCYHEALEGFEAARHTYQAMLCRQALERLQS